MDKIDVGAVRTRAFFLNIYARSYREERCTTVSHAEDSCVAEAALCGIPDSRLVRGAPQAISVYSAFMTSDTQATRSLSTDRQLVYLPLFIFSCHDFSSAFEALVRITFGLQDLPSSMGQLSSPC